MNKINPYYIVKTAFVKQAGTMSMPFTPNNTPTYSFDELTGSTPSINNNPWKTTMQHPAIPDINQRYSSKPYTAWRFGIPQPGYEREPGTGETAEEHLNAIRNTDLLRFLLSRGYNTKQEPYIAHLPITPDRYYVASFRQRDKNVGPNYGRVQSDLTQIPLTGHEVGHGADLNEKWDYKPAYRHYPEEGNSVPSSEILRRETAATLGHYAALHKALEDRPDLWGQYVNLSLPSLAPALGTYYAQFLPNALKEYGNIASGSLNTLIGLKNPTNWSTQKIKNNFKKGQSIFNKYMGAPKKEYTFQDMTPLQDKLQRIFSRSANNYVEKASTKEQWKSLITDLREYAKQNYGFQNSIPWYDQSQSPEQNILNNTQRWKPEKLQFRDNPSK